MAAPCSTFARTYSVFTRRTFLNVVGSPPAEWLKRDASGEEVPQLTARVLRDLPDDSTTEKPVTLSER
jgi:hypothetical protein